MPATDSAIRLFVARHRHELHLLLAILVVVVLTTLLDSNHTYWHRSGDNAAFILWHTATLGIFSLGAAIVIISGGIDLSSGSVIAFSGTVCASAMLLLAPEEMIRQESVGTGVIAAAITVTLVVGFLIGSLHAWLITVIGLPPFVATLATLVGLRSLGRAVCEQATKAVRGGVSTQIDVADPNFRALGTHYVWPLLIFAVLALATWVLLSRTVTGRHLYALGGNEQAARLSGIRTERVKWLAYCLSAVLSSIAGILLVGFQSVANPQTLGRGYELNAIAAAVVGGCSLQGGVGTIPGTVLGALFLRVVIDGVAKIIKTSADVYEGLIVGVVVVFAVTFTQAERAERRQTLFAGALGLVTIANLALLAAGMAALVGPTLLAGHPIGRMLHLEATHLALLAGGATLALLSLMRLDVSRNWRRALVAGLAVLTVVAAVVVDRQIPAWKTRTALAAVGRVGGTVTDVADGAALDFSGQALTDVDLRQLADHLPQVPRLVELRLRDTSVTNDGLRHLERIAGLKRLDVTGTAVTRAGLRRLPESIEATGP